MIKITYKRAFPLRVKTVTAVATALLLLAGNAGPAVAAPPAASVASAVSRPAPNGVKYTSRSDTKVSLSWRAVSGVSRYRVQISKRPDMSDSFYYRYSDTMASIGGLKPNTAYYFRVRAISPDGRKSLSNYSSRISTKTLARAVAPGNLASSGQTSSSIALKWNSWPGANRYRIQYSKKSDMSNATYFRFSGTSADIRALASNTTYYFRVRAISANGATNLSEYSPVISARTKSPSALAAVTAPLSVASYNIKCANCFSGAVNELPWAERRGAVVSTITGEMPDVIGVQEASQGWLKDDSRPGGISQFEDLEERLNAAGASYKVTNDKRNNCVKHTTPSDCEYQDHGASQGTRLFYNTKTVELVSQGSVRLPEIRAENNDRYMAWGIFIQRNTGKKFFVGNTHLEPGGGDELQDLRKRQTEVLLSEIREKNPDNLPVLVTGDFNSHKWTEPSNVPYDVMTRAGFIDPLGNTYGADIPSGAATAERRVGAFYDSYNKFNRLANAREKSGNGTYLDYIFTSRMRVSEWETVVKVDGGGNFVGTIPSDHNMLKATVQLP